MVCSNVANTNSIVRSSGRDKSTDGYRGCLMIETVGLLFLHQHEQLWFLNFTVTVNWIYLVIILRQPDERHHSLCVPHKHNSDLQPLYRHRWRWVECILPRIQMKTNSKKWMYTNAASTLPCSWTSLECRLCQSKGLKWRWAVRERRGQGSEGGRCGCGGWNNFDFSTIKHNLMSTTYITAPWQ